VLVSLDTTRADHLGVYGAERPTPRLDALARRGLVFEQAVTTSENTLISHASLLTGLFPAVHATTHVGQGTPLAPAYRTIAEDLREAGWRTAAFTAHGDWLTPAFGLDQGFEVFEHGYRDAEAVVAQARAHWTSRDPAASHFVFVHVFDVHSDRTGRPYWAPPPYAGRYTGDYEGPLRWPSRAHPDGSRFLAAVGEGTVTLGPGDRRHLVDQYDEGLAYVDQVVGGWLLELADGPHPPWIVVTADHGEAFGEHGRMLHETLHDEIVRVPLIVVPPPAARAALGAPRRVEAQVRLVDLRPTLAAWAGLTPPAAHQGLDLGAWLAGRARAPDAPAPLYHVGLRRDGFKLLRTPQGEHLYDLRADPGEQVDLAGRPEHRERLAAMRAWLRGRRASDAALREALVNGEPAPADLDEAARARLEELGYLR